MTREEFDALLRRRDDKQREHTLACQILEEGDCNPLYQHRKCVRLYDELAELQEQIDAELAAERAAEEASS